MANVDKLTPLSDPSNVQWVIERPGDVTDAPAPTTPRPKMAVYTELIASINYVKKKFDESKVKRGKGGKFAKKADSLGSASAPPKPSAQLELSGKVMDAYLLTQTAETTAEGNRAFQDYTDLRAQYEAKHGAWSPTVHDQLQTAYDDEVANFNATATKKIAAPARKTATPTAPGKKLTNKIVYGKHANGTIVETTDGQHRMVYNEAGNNWTVQERTPDGAWQVVDVLGKGAAYKKAQELSSEWGEPHDGTPAELTPVAAGGTSGPFAPGWDDLTDANISSFNQLQINTAFQMQNPGPDMSGALLAQNVANIAQTYNVTPEQVVALADMMNGNNDFSDALKKHLDGGNFPPPIYPSTAKKLAAGAKKTATKKAAEITPTTAPSTPPVGVATPSAPAGHTATTNPFALAQSGQPYEFNDLVAQSDSSIDVDQLRQKVMYLSNSGAPQSEIDAATLEYVNARKKYAEKYGVAWSPNHHAALTQMYVNELGKKSVPALATGDPISGAPSGVVVGATAQTLTGVAGMVVGPAVTAQGNPGVELKLPDGSSKIVSINAVKKSSDAVTKDLADAPAEGTKIDHPTLGQLTVAGSPTVGATGEVVVPVLKSDGSITKLTLKSLNAAPPPAPATSSFSVGTTVTTPSGPGTVTDMSPSGKKLEITHPDGTKSFVDAGDVAELPPSAMPSASTSSTSGALPLTTGAVVATPHGNGIIVGTSPSGALYSVKLSNGSSVLVPDTDVSEITPTAPATPAPTPAPNPGVTYDADGVPVLSLAQQHSVATQFQSAGVNWYNSSESLFDAAYAASQATGLSIDDVLKYADTNFHNSSQSGGKPIQTKVAKWAKSSKGKAHIQAQLGTAAAAPVTPSPPITASGAGSSDISGVPKAKKTQAYSQFTAGLVTVNNSPGSLAQKAADVAKNTGLTPEQVLAIVDEKKAAAAGVPNGNLFSNKVTSHLGGKPFPSATPASTTSSHTGTPSGSGGVSASTAFALTPGHTTLSPSQATQMQAQMVSMTTPWTASQRASLKYYTGPNYTSVNKCLRFGTGCTPTIKKHIANASAGMRPTTQNITTFRGTSLQAFGATSVADLESMVGSTVSEPGFTSTSVLTSSAFSGSVAMQIDVPAGTPGAYVAGISHYPENEFVLPPGTKFRIIEVKPAAGGKKAFVHVEVVPA